MKVTARQLFQTEGLSMDVPIIDALEPVASLVVRRDVKGATPRSPENCAGARSFVRSLTINGQKVLAAKMGPEVTYFHMGDHILRFGTSRETAEMIRAYDAVGFFPTGVTVRLLPPSKSALIGARTGQKPGGARTGTGKSTVRSPQRPWLRHILQG